MGVHEGFEQRADARNESAAFGDEEDTSRARDGQSARARALPCDWIVHEDETVCVERRRRGQRGRFSLVQIGERGIGCAIALHAYPSRADGVTQLLFAGPACAGEHFASYR